MSSSTGINSIHRLWQADEFTRPETERESTNRAGSQSVIVGTAQGEVTQATLLVVALIFSITSNAAFDDLYGAVT